MRRNMALIRDMLLRLENGHIWSEGESLDKIEGYPSDQLWYHFYLLGNSPYADLIPNENGPSYLELTYAGHDFLELIRDEQRWNRARQLIKQRTGDEETSVDVLIDALKHIIDLRGQRIEHLD